jgi:hypothetical protein
VLYLNENLAAKDAKMKSNAKKLFANLCVIFAAFAVYFWYRRLPNDLDVAASNDEKQWVLKNLLESL